MTEIVVRQATLADTHAITDIHCSTVEGGVFTRRNPDGTRTPIAYEELSIFERYLNGGPWMSVETCAVWLAHLLRYGDEIPLVAEAEGVVLGEAEVTIGQEPPPYGYHLNISVLSAHAEVKGDSLVTALMDYVKQMASVMTVQQIQVPFVEATDFYTEHGFKPLMARREVILPTKEGRVFYKATNMEVFNPASIHGWYMPIGRHQNARHEWERIWPGFWNGVPELVEPETARFEITLTGQRGVLLLQQDRYRPQRAAAYLWTERALSPHMVSAMRDRAARLGYEELSVLVDDTSLAFVESEAIESGNVEMLYVWRVE